MLLSKKHNFIFVHIYKNAGTSITKALQPFVLNQRQWLFYRAWRKIKFLPSLPPVLNPQPCYIHAKTPEIIEYVGHEVFDSFFSFAIVRNPWDWQVSLYTYILKLKNHYQHDLVKKLGSFDEYIKWRCNGEVSYQKDFIYSSDNRLLVDYVGRFENLEADFQEICTKIGINASLAKLNVSNTVPYQEFYTDRTRELVEQTFRSDIDLLGYSF